MNKYLFYINGKITVVYSEDVYTKDESTLKVFDHQEVYTESKQNIMTFNVGQSVQNVYTFAKELDPNYQRCSEFRLIFPCLKTKEGYFTLDGKTKIGSTSYSKAIFDSSDLSLEELHFVLTRYNDMKDAIASFNTKIEKIRIKFDNYD